MTFEPYMTRWGIMLCLAATLFGALLSTVVVNPAVFVWNCVGLSLLLVACRSLDDKAYRAVLVVLCINLALMALLYAGYLAKYGSPYFLGNSDDYNFDRYGAQAVSEGLYTPGQIQASSDFIFNNSISYICYISWIMRIAALFGGYHPFLPRILNVYYLTILCVLTYKYFLRHADVSALKGRLLIYGLGLFPNAMFVAIHNFRDAFAALLLFTVFYLWDLFPQRKFRGKGVIVLATLLIAYWMFWLRSVTLVLIALFILVSLAAGNRTFRWRWTTLAAVAVGAFALAQGASALGFFELLDLYNQVYNEAFANSSSGLSLTVFATPLLPLGLWMRALYGLIIPVPALPPVFDIPGFFQLLNSCGTILQILLLPYLVLNFRSLDKVLIVFFSAYGAIILTTFGFRHFIMLYPFMAIMIGREFAATGMARHYLYLAGMAGVLVFLMPVYLFLKG